MTDIRGNSHTIKKLGTESDATAKLNSLVHTVQSRLSATTFINNG